MTRNTFKERGKESWYHTGVPIKSPEVLDRNSGERRLDGRLGKILTLGIETVPLREKIPITGFYSKAKR